MKPPLYAPFFLGLFFLITTSLMAQKNKPLDLGASIPMSEQMMIGVSNQEMSLEDIIEENGLLVIFSCNTCPFVVMWEDRYLELEEKCQNKNIGMVYLNANKAKRDSEDSLEAMKAHAKKMGYNYPYLIDKNSTLANAFGAKTTPHIYLFNKQKKLVYKGAIDDNYQDATKVKENYLLDAIDQMVAGKEILITQSKAIGCSIKREKK